MPATKQNVQRILDRVTSLLHDGEKQDIHLKLDEYQEDEDWLYVVVTPTQTGIRASEYAEYMSHIERVLRNEGDDKVYLVPALED